MKTLNLNLGNITITSLIDEVRTLEKGALLVAIHSAYLNGVTIPSYEVRNDEGEVVETMEATKIDKSAKMSFSQIADKVGYSKTYVKYLVDAVKLIIDEGIFQDFIDGDIHFNQDKIRLILDEDNKKVFENDSFANLMKLTYNTLTNRVKRYEAPKNNDDNADGNEGEGEGENNDEGEGKDNAEVVTIEYEGKFYKVDKIALEKLLETAEEIEVEEE